MDKKDIQKLIEKKDLLLSLETEKQITWCSGCGNYGILNALSHALVLENFERNDFALFFDVGCNGNGADKIEANTIHGLHGRVIPLASGAALANPSIKCIAMGGDGGTFNEGLSHLMHGIRNDIPMLFILHNNENFGLTTGQSSSTTPIGTKMNSSPDGTPTDSLNVLEVVMSCKPSFVARTYSGDINQMTKVLQEALKHDGFAFVEVIQACPTYNRETPEHWYQQRIKDIRELEKYKPEDKKNILEVIEKEPEIFYTGVLYKNPNKKNFLTTLKNRLDSTNETQNVKHYDITELI